MPTAPSTPAPGSALAAPLRALAEQQPGGARAALLHAADELEQLPAARRPIPAASVLERRQAESLAARLERVVWRGGALSLPWQDLEMLRALDPPTAQRLFAAALAQWPAAAAAELAGQRALDPLREALVQLTTLLQWQLQALDEGPSLAAESASTAVPRDRDAREQAGNAHDLAERRRKAEVEAAAIRSMMESPKKVLVATTEEPKPFVKPPKIAKPGVKSTLHKPAVGSSVARPVAPADPGKEVKSAKLAASWAGDPAKAIPTRGDSSGGVGRSNWRGGQSDHRDHRDEQMPAAQADARIFEVEVPETITVADLAHKMSTKASEVIKQLVKLGQMVTVNQPLDQDTAMIVVEEMGHTAVIVSLDKPKAFIEEKVQTQQAESPPRSTRSAPGLDPHVATPAPAPQPACFHFLLQGQHAQGQQMREHTEADLHFRYDAPPVDALATVQHDALDTARAQDLDVTLQLTPCGAITIVGERRALVQLRGGRIATPVLFRLRALAAPAGPAAQEEHGVHVQFVVRGETVHQQLLSIQVQPATARSRGAAPAPAPAQAEATASAGPTAGLLAAAATAAPPPRHTLRLSLSVDGASLRMELDHHVDGELWWSGDATSQAYDAAGLADLAIRARGELADCYSQHVAFWQRFDGTLADGDPTQGLQYALWCAAAAGATLNQELRQDPGVAALLDYVEQVPDGAVLTITTDRVFLPWELLTPQKWGKRWTQAQRDRQPLDAQRFWGARFAIETTPRRLPVGERALAHLRARPRRISVNVNPDIHIDGLDDARQPQQLHQQWAARLAQAQTLDGALNATCDPMRDVLQNAQHQASLIYLYCHGQSAQPFGGSDERLVLDEGCPLAPGDLVGDADYREAPLVFLNACDSGMPSPLAFASFLREFCQRGAIGLIATTNAVPISFAAHFGPQLVDRYLQCEGPLSEMLRQLRRDHLARGNPVALFYTLQCKLSFPRTAGAPA